MDLIVEHVTRFNAGVRSGDYGPMLEQFTDDAELAFEGVGVGPFVGRGAIADAYRRQPPDDELDLLEVSEIPGGADRRVCMAGPAERPGRGDALPPARGAHLAARRHVRRVSRARS